VSRRGYLLDAPVIVDAKIDLVAETVPNVVSPQPSVTYRPTVIRRALARLLPTRNWLWGSAAAVPIVGAMAYGAVAFLPAPPEGNELFRDEDNRRIAAIAAEKELPLPAFQISRIANIPERLHRFVGVWVSTSGFVNSKRQFMLVITDVEKSGIVTGFTVRGPREALSLVKDPAGSSFFKAYISGDTFRYSGPASEREVVLAIGNKLEYSEVFTSGATVRVVLDPVWTLAQAEGRFARVQ
jgi:hypothetical protein